MKESSRKNDSTGSTRFHKTLSNKIGSDRTSYYIDGLTYSVFAESTTSSQFKDSDTQNHTQSYYMCG